MLALLGATALLLTAAGGPAAVDADAAQRFAGLALDCIHKEYPGKIAHVLSGDQDVQPPHKLTPAFFGCYDWHSAVHGHWLLVRLTRTFPQAPFASRARNELANSLTPENIAAEVRYLEGPGRASFERPYGLAWLLQLAAELRAWDDEQARAWSAALKPLEAAAAASLKSWLPKLTYPIRIGEHDQTAFAFGLVLDWARAAGDQDMVALLNSRIEAFYLKDKACPLDYEPSGQDFLSPCLGEADLMRRVLPPDRYAAWLGTFLPQLPRDGSTAWLTPAVVTDPSDPKLAHLDGLNLSRAWMLLGMARGLPPSDPRVPGLRATAAAHREAGLRAVTGAHYEGGHWLGTFAVYLETAEGAAAPAVSSTIGAGKVGRTEIAKWQDGKKGAVSLTYDDGTLNQFRVAVPIMDRFGFPATFFIITGEVAGSRYDGTFVGRPTHEIVQETAQVPTNPDNLFERASAAAFLGSKGGLDAQTRAGEAYDERGDVGQACRIMDEAYAEVRRGASAGEVAKAPPSGERRSWDEFAALAKRGYEFASHTVTHPRLAILDDANLAYELEKSRQDILDHLGFQNTFSVECPYGTENPRAVKAALARYPLARNLMPDAFVEDLDRSSDKDPARSTQEYVRWQRGPLTKTPPSLMKSWIDTVASHEHIWLVLVFHGVDGIGWEARTGAELTEYLGYLKSKEGELWVATFRDVAKYMRERMHASVRSYPSGSSISVVLRDDLTDVAYDLPLTLKTEVPSGWTAAEVRQGSRSQRVPVRHEGADTFLLYQAMPNAEDVTLTALASRGSRSDTSR